MSQRKVVHVHLKGLPDDVRADFYFGSVAAIYQVFTPAEIGVRYTSLSQYLWQRNGVFDNDKCRVIVGELISKPHQNNKKI